MWSSIDACLLFVAGKECKIGLPHSMTIHRGVMKCDDCAVDYVVRNCRPCPSIFAYCKLSKTGAREGLGMRLGQLG